MAGRILDSNIVIDLFRKDDYTINKLKKVSRIYLPVIVLGELFYGANLSNRVKQRLAEIEQFSSKVILLDCNKKTAELYGKIKSVLKKKGTPIPENDIWIAAIAKQHQLIVVSDDKHFKSIDGLKVEKWR